jgi:hypothetical protein
MTIETIRNSETTNENNLAKLQNITKTLTVEQRSTFHNVLIGSLSVTSASEDWDSAIRIASGYIAR